MGEFSRTNGPGIYGSPSRLTTLPQAFFSENKYTPPYLWKPHMSDYFAAGACFCFPENGPHILRSPTLLTTLPQALFVSSRKMAPSCFRARLTHASGSGCIQFVIPWDVQSIRRRHRSMQTQVIAFQKHCNESNAR